MNVSIIFYYHRLNCYSFNALAGAIDVDPELTDLHVDIALTEDQVESFCDAAVAQYNRAVLALSILTCQLDEMRSLIQRLRLKCGADLTIIAGGPHATACPDEVLTLGADFVLRGEAESAFPALLKRIMHGNPPEQKTSSGARINLDDYPSFSPKRGMFGPIEITRGCAFACNYCQTSHIFGVALRHRSVESIVRQTATLRSVNRKVVRLLSPNAFSYGSADGRVLNLKSVRELLSCLRASVPRDTKIIFAHFPSEVRPEHVTKETLDLLQEFADNDEIVIGAQSGSMRMLEACRRSHDVESVLTAVSLARRYGYKIIVDFIFGLPGETAEDIEETLAVMNRIVDIGARIHPHIFAPLPQTAFAKAPPGFVSPQIANALNEIRLRRGLWENREKRPVSKKRGQAPFL